MMLLDEPTAGMTHEDVERIAALIKKVSANRTVLMVEHNLSVVSTLSDHITVLARGEVLAAGQLRGRVEESRTCRGVHGSRTWLSALPPKRRQRRARRRCSPCATCTRGMASRTSCTASTSTSRRGEVVTLLGRNGAGKTTTLQVDHGRRAAARGLDRLRAAGDRAPAVEPDRAPAASPGARRSAASSRA